MNHPKCPKCKSTQCVKRGKSPTQQRGLQQRYLCKKCKKTFIPDMGFWKMKNKPETITMSIDMYLSNLSSRKMRNQLKRHFNHKISHVSILDWVRKYVLKVQKYVDTFTPQLSGKFYADETEIPRGKKHSDIFWCCVDWGTRFINAQMYSPFNQDIQDATTFMDKIKQSGIPKYVQTDAAQFYPQAFKNIFYLNKGKRVDQPEHRVVNFHKTKKHNVRIETVFMKIKDRVDDFRGLKAFWSAPILLAGIVLQHNFIEDHTTTREKPSETAGIKFSEKNRWLQLIKLSSQII